jgi:uncharacterized protein YutE (UPF0331/DUF86 family)
MADDVVVNKAAIIERCIARVREEYAGDERNLTENITRQDSIILNLQRACEAAIDLAMHIVRRRQLGVPQETRDAFRLLQENKILSVDLADRLMRMVGFRNIAIHDYRRRDLEIVKRIIASNLDDFLAFTATLLKQSQ